MSHVLIHEVGPRDGLQAEQLVVPTATKLDWIRRLDASGVDIVQVGSFVKADRMPQMADTDELFRILGAEAHGALLSGLVLNEKGLERALEVGVELVCMGVSASETHSRKNTGMGTEEALRRILPMALAARKAAGWVRVGLVVAAPLALGSVHPGIVAAESLLAEAELRSPFDGTVLKRHGRTDVMPGGVSRTRRGGVW